MQTGRVIAGFRPMGAVISSARTHALRGELPLSSERIVTVLASSLSNGTTLVWNRERWQTTAGTDLYLGGGGSPHDGSARYRAPVARTVRGESARRPSGSLGNVRARCHVPHRGCEQRESHRDHG